MQSIILDNAKAFDVFSHTVLINKAEAIGFSPMVLGWINAFLRNRLMQDAGRSGRN